VARAGSLAAVALVACSPALGDPVIHHPSGPPAAHASLDGPSEHVVGDVVCLAVSWQHVCEEENQVTTGSTTYGCDKLPFDVVVRCTGAACERAVIDDYGFGGAGVIPIRLAQPGELQLHVTLSERNGKRTAEFHLPTIVATVGRPHGITSCNEPPVGT
jgi:hypothetical protein